MLTEAIHPGAFIVSEEDAHHTREAALIGLNQTIVPGTVLGATDAVAGVTSSAAADASNTGNGTFTLDGTAPVGASAKDGKYRVVCIAVATNGGEFVVNDPSGVEIGRVAVGATFNSDIKFVIADGSADFAAGDAFTVTVGVEQADLEYRALNLSATSGEQNVAGIAVYGVTTDGSTKQSIAAIVRGPAQVRGSDLTWPAGITAAQKAEAIVQLSKHGIIVR